VKEKVVIIGLGYVGLPLACLSAKKGFKTTGLDISRKIVDLTNAGKSHIKDVGLEKNVKAVKGKLIATTDASAIKNADFVVVCVPTPVDEQHLPDLKPLESACRSVASNISKGQTIIVESTIYPGTIEEVVKPILESSGLKAEKDFFLVHCPERIDPGNKKWHLENIPRVIGGLSDAGTKKAIKFYSKIIAAKITQLKSVKEAEAVKVAENTFRDINIAFVNELAKSFDKMGIDVVEVIKGASTKPFGYMPFYPGPGVGGHCIAVDPYYLIEKAKSKGFEHKFLKLARQINDSMADFVVEKVEAALNQASKAGKDFSNAKIAVLGVAYKANIDDARESPALKIILILEGKGAKPLIFDPHIPDKSNANSLDSAIKNADVVVLATNHSVFLKQLTPSKLKSSGVKAIVDARNCLDSEAIKKAGIKYFAIGRQ
jgi:UDP-N-acetyl-D-glucosamine dehydrogenase